MTHEKEGFYSLPGGGLDYGENIEKALTEKKIIFQKIKKAQK